MQALIVTAAFADFQRGDLITDAALIATTMKSTNAANVVQVTVADPPAAPTPPKGK